MTKKILFIDMDDTIADFYKVAADHRGLVDEGRMYNKDFFLDLEPIAGALQNVRRLINLGFDVQILTQPLYNSHLCYAEKAKWIQLWFPELANKITMTQDKGLLVGHYLIDDNEGKWKDKFEKNGGKFVTFNYIRDGWNPEQHSKEWDKIYQFFLNEDPQA